MSKEPTAAVTTPDVESSEILARQIKDGAGEPIWFDPSRTPPLAWQLFRPTNSDGEGLSMIRLRHRSEPWAAYRPTQPDIRFRLARMIVDDLGLIAISVGIGGFGVKTDPDELDNEHGEPWAHVLLSAINRKAYDADAAQKLKIINWLKAVAAAIPLLEITDLFDRPGAGILYRP
jgi:hypothetical protein